MENMGGSGWDRAIEWKGTGGNGECKIINICPTALWLFPQ